jgi:hypothetical protein
MYSEAGAEEPKKVKTVLVAQPHGDHFHLYVLTLIRDDLNPTLHTMTDTLLNHFRALDMDDRATVSAYGAA